MHYAVCGPATPSPPHPLQWNWIDFVVVIGGYISLLPGIGNISALRIIRVMRPLRTLKRIKKLKVRGLVQYALTVAVDPCTRPMPRCVCHSCHQLTPHTLPLHR